MPESTPFHACTILARNYWAQARDLQRSVLEHHPDVRLSVLLIDPDEHTDSLATRELFDVLRPLDVGIDRREFHRMAACYDLLELATAMKPWLLRFLLEKYGRPIVYLDPDIELFAPITDAAELADVHGIALTPHTVAPLPEDEYGPNELAILQAGVYNLGFIAVGASAVPFLDWWRDRLRRDCLISKEEGMFVDQRWVDFAPTYFDPAVLRSPGWNLAYWNMPARHLRRSGAGLEVDGHPLRFFHYSGFDADRPDVLSYYQGDRPRIRLDENPVLAELCGRYAQRLLRFGYRAYSRIPYGFEATPSGLPLDERIRRLYRRELVGAERSGGTEPPNPFEPDESAAFEDWLRTPLGPYGMTRYLKTLYDERNDLHSSFTDVDGPKGSMFADWVRTEGRFECKVPPQLVLGDVPSEGMGVNLAGYVKAENGLGEGTRGLSSVLDAAGVVHVVVPYDNTPSRQASETLDERFGEPTFPTNIVCVNADQTPVFLDHAGPAFTDGRYTIGMWSWEVDRMPEEMGRSSELVDEIWAPSEHAAGAIRSHTTKPVLVAPHPVTKPDVRVSTRAELGLPDGFLFLFSFDFDSVLERKNPLDVIDAFSRAFTPGEGPKLVIKSVRGDAHPDGLERLRAAASRHPDVMILDGYVSRADYFALVGTCDAYVSLHRAEGFGLTMAEAMALSKPVIATGYSGNLEFMDETNSWLVPYELVTVGKGSAPYPKDARWAQPDVDVAAALMREVVDDPSRARERGLRAAFDIRRLHAPEARTGFVTERLRRSHDTLHRRAVGERERLRVWTPADAAASLVSSGPVFDSPTRYGGASTSFRRLLMRVLRHFGEHQSKIHSSLIESVRELEERLRAQDATTRALEWHVQELARQLAIAQRGDTEAVPPPVNGELEELLAVPVLDRRAAYMDLLAGHSPVLYVSCGDGEMLDLLAQRGVETVDIDLDPKDVDRVDYLEAIGDSSLGGILSARVVELMSPGDLWRFLELSRRKLTNDGLLVAETVNPPVVQAPKRTTVGGVSAISPETLVALCRLTGFESAYAFFGDTTDRAGRLDRTRRAQMEYVVVAQSSS